MFVHMWLQYMNVVVHIPGITKSQDVPLYFLLTVSVWILRRLVAHFEGQQKKNVHIPSIHWHTSLLRNCCKAVHLLFHCTCVPVIWCFKVKVVGIYAHARQCKHVHTEHIHLDLSRFPYPPLSTPEAQQTSQWVRQCVKLPGQARG
jgi:lipid-A-disaccharide synthase-like uncharacterized protein